ncbi:MAG: clostripain-related cysteine peptidase [Thermodesulfobacteriota bacterium]
MTSRQGKNKVGICLYKRIAVLLTCLLLAGCGGGGGGGGNSNNSGSPDADWTYMVYMGADNNLSTAGLVDLNEMETAGSDEKVNIVLQAEFSEFYTDFSVIDREFYEGETLRFLVQNDGNPDNVNLGAGQSLGNVDMGTAATLTSFIQWARATYPAKHYALVIWDHGAGWKKSVLFKGAVQDETSDSFMTLPELAGAVRNAGLHFDVINFDACLMAMYEVAYEFLELTDYMVFSEETEPGDGDPYDTILAELKVRPDMTGRQLSDMIVEKYYAYYSGPGTRGERITKSAVDMSLIPELHTAMMNFANAIVADYDNVSGVIAQVQANAQGFEYAANLDLYDFASRIANRLLTGAVRNTALEVSNAVTRAVVSNRTVGNAVNDATGLAVFVPARGQVSSDTLYDDLREYNLLACNQIRSTVWSDAVETIVSGAEETLHPGGFAFYVSWDTDADLDLYVWEPNLEIYAPWMGQTTPNGFFSADSYDVGVSEEYYVANDYVLPGQYDVFIEYFKDGANSRGANVEFWYLDPDVGEWQMTGPIWMDLSNPYTGDFSDLDSLLDLNDYSNFWYTWTFDRAMPEEGGVTINAGGRQVTFHIPPKKRAPQLSEELK